MIGWRRYRQMKETINQWLAGVRGLAQGESGLGLADSLVAVAILGLAVTAFVVALSTGSIAVREREQQVVAQRLVQTQLEYVKNYAYDPDATTYPAVDTPEGYAISVAVTPLPDTDTDIQKITVTASQEGEELLIVEDYKVNR
jgi:type II secretory pathway pseudopilin PulG